MKDTSFSGIQKDSSRAFANFACGINKIDINISVRREFPDADRKLHQQVDIIGNIAAETGAGTMVLSQFMARSLKSLEENLIVFRSRTSGSPESANDLVCFNT